MTTSDYAQTFKCPSCGAPLEVEAGKKTMKCSYCGDSVVIPTELRIAAKPTLESAPPPRLSVPPAYVSAQTQNTAVTPRRLSCLGGLIAAVVIVLVLSMVSTFVFNFNPFGTFFFANQVLTFGSEGIGAGLFQDPRAIGVDGNGNIVVADYGDGRIQTFSPDGKFISTFTVKNNSGKAANVMDIAVSHDGKIYVPNGDIFIYDESGKELGRIVGDTQHYFVTSIALGGDGTVYALTFGEDNLVHFKADGSLDFEIQDPISSVTGQGGGFPQLAVDGLGNIYIADGNSAVVLKYSPQGKYLDQFGGKAKDISNFEAGKFVHPMGIAIDGYGRIFINDSYDLQVFDSTGKYLNSISGGYYGIAFDEQNNLYTTLVTKNSVAKFQIQKPVGQ